MPNPTRKHTVCTLEGCDNGGRITRGLCKMHYARWLRHGEVGGAKKQHAVSWEGAECCVPGCQRSVRSRGLCLAHYKRMRKYGDPTGRPVRRSALERFTSNVGSGTTPDARPGLGPCQMWMAGVGKHGYGVFHPRNGVTTTAHRWAYRQFVGPIPEGHVIDHLCRVRACVNPDHLEAVTNEENLRRGAGYGLRNGMREACIHGHKYTPENTYTDPNGGIRCRTCQRIADRKRKRTA